MGQNMRKALAQNPNLLRTLIGLGITLIILLSYAVYSATVSPNYYIYSSDVDEIEVDLVLQEPYHDESENTTTWTWTADLNTSNLSWVNLSLTDLSSNASVRLSNGGGLWSHSDLGITDAIGFSCMVSCVNKTSHFATENNGEISIITLTDPEPSLRGKGAVFANSITEGEEKARGLLDRNHTHSTVTIIVTENGNRSAQPAIELTSVNEEFSNIERFEVDTATEFLWALAAVIGCFSMVLVPSFTVYFAARAKQRKVDLLLKEADAKLSEE
jgi:hypothetical protein